MSMKPSGLFEIIGTVATFEQRFDTKMQESVQKGGTADGINYQIEYWANLADALAYTLFRSNEKISKRACRRAWLHRSVNQDPTQ